MSEVTFYLLHLQRPYEHARHYMGSTTNLKSRLARHKNGTSRARFMQVVFEAGIAFALTRTWRGTRPMEYQLKRRHASPRLCPVCDGKLRGDDVVQLMRGCGITIRALAERMDVTQARVREARARGVEGEAYVRDWIQGITGDDPGGVNIGERRS